MKLAVTEFVSIDGVSQGPGPPEEDTGDVEARVAELKRQPGHDEDLASRRKLRATRSLEGWNGMGSEGAPASVLPCIAGPRGAALARQAKQTEPFGVLNDAP